ncbi:MAG TPA: glycosyltransferase family 4 protein [Thermoanaerobaculia bacterium]|nr:glycosyltransferase family 4 protein [Thermoanaerobaculia bacterium]
MKIALVELAGKGGLSHYAWQLASAMQRRGASVTLVTDREQELAALPHPFALRPILRLWDPKPADDSTGAFARRARRGIRALRYYREWERARREIRRLRPDVIQLGDIRFATDLVPVRRLRALAPVLADVCHNVRPFSGGEGSSGAFELSSIERSLYRRIYREFDAIFVHYHANVREFAATFPESAGAVHRIVHGNERIFDALASPGLGPSDLRRRIGIGPDDRVVLFFGTLSAYKGLDLLLASFRRVAAAVPEARLVLAGFPFPDFDVDAFRGEAAAAGLSDRVILIPRYVESAEVRAWIELGEVVVFPYRSIFQSGALHLACTFGVPIVATRVGANDEVIRDGETGLLVPPEDESELAGAIARILRDGDLARSLGAAAARDAETRLSWDGVASTILAAYDELLGRGRT